MLHISKQQHHADTDLFRNWTKICGFTKDIVVVEPSHLTISGHLNLVHRNLVIGPVGWALDWTLHRKDTVEELGQQFNNPVPNPANWSDRLWSEDFIPGALTAANISNYDDHYAQGCFEAYALLQPGAYRLQCWGNSHSDAAPNTDGLIEVYTGPVWFRPYNQAIYRIESA